MAWYEGGIGGGDGERGDGPENVGRRIGGGVRGFGGGDGVRGDEV